MNYQIELQSSGLFVVSTAVGKPLFDGAFRSDIPDSVREAVLNLLAAGPELLEMLRWSTTAADRLAQTTPAGVLRDAILEKAENCRLAIESAVPAE
jgi:hypothetical protein